MLDQLMGNPETVMPRPQILIIDDELETVEEIASYLAYRGYTCHTASDGLEGLNAIQGNQEIGIVITDVRMPRLDGVGFLANLADAIPDEQPVEVVVISGHRDDSIIAGARKSVPLHFIGKPIDLKELLYSVQTIEARVLDQRELSTGEAPMSGGSSDDGD